MEVSKGKDMEMNRRTLESRAIHPPIGAKYAAIYCRVSTEDQGKGFSIPTQVEACQRLAAREGYPIPEAYILIDEGISGTTLDRPGLRRLRDFIQI
jgi:DNA invertase Pin-like site-specific DNA recombinase